MIWSKGGADRGTFHTDSYTPYAGAAVGDLVKTDPAVNQGILAADDGQEFFGMIIALGAGDDICTVEEYGPTGKKKFAFSGALALGNSVVSGQTLATGAPTAATRGVVKAAGGANPSIVQEVDSPSSGFAVVGWLANQT